MPSRVLCTCIALWLPEAWVPSQDAFQQPGEARGGERVEERRGGEGWTPGEVGKRREGENIDLITKQL